MYFHKYPHVANFEFAQFLPSGKMKTGRGDYRFKMQAGANGTHFIQVVGKGWSKTHSQADLVLPKNKPGQSATVRAEITPEGAFRLNAADGTVLLESLPGRFFGQCGEASLFEFVREKGDLFYGLGEKWSGLEHSGKTTKFWNTDVWADFNPEAVVHGRPAPDPVYVSIPYLILKRGENWLGFLLDNPEATFISTGTRVSIAQQLEVQESEMRGASTGEGFIHFGAESGQPRLFVLVGGSLAELTRNLQTLIGTTPRPPAWALGYHQCRWGYKSEEDLCELDRKFREHEILVDGLWLDIDYMDGYRVFTFDSSHFPDPEAAVAKMADAGRKVVPIIDPGVKMDPGYAVYERGRKENAFCRNPQGCEYVGLVWPGRTVFPDFSLPSVREWWSREVADFAKIGIPGAWLDMNDPATGPVKNEDMLFDNGRESHSTFHNQYAFGMARATYEGFLKAHPEQRPFLLSRSGSTGSNRYAAIWTGDNFSNYHHLKSSIATTLNLGLSGIPFNAPDCGGFGGDTSAELMCDWFKAAFLFPFFRNHSILNSRSQEPWAFNRQTLNTLRRYIQLRYRFRPYLYQLFIEHECSGEAVLRPLFYDFPGSAEQSLETIDDQFMVGPQIMQAPFVEEKAESRAVVLPGGPRWFDLTEGEWIDGGQTLRVMKHKTHTPLYIRDNSILPLARILPADHQFKGEQIDFHIFLSEDGCASARYTWDDGCSFAYRDGDVSKVWMEARREGADLFVTTETICDRQGQGDFSFTVEKDIRRVWVNGTLARKIKRQGIVPGGKVGQAWVSGC